MRILITGGNGYVGRELCRMAYESHEVCVIDSLRKWDNRFREDERDRFRFLVVDIRDPVPVVEAVSEFSPEVIVHLAAVHFIPDCENDPTEAAAINVAGTVSLLKACPDGCRFVFASSGAVYGPEEQPHREDRSPLEPQDVYGWTKLHGEQWVRYFAEKRGFPAAVVRLFNVVGPGETNPHVLPEIIAQLKAGRVVIELGNIEPKRDYIDVLDAASGFLSVATRGRMAPRQAVTVNLGTQRGYSVRELLDRLKKVAGIDFTVERDPGRVRPVDRPHLRADRTRIGEQFGWEPRYTIDATLRRTWEEPDLLPGLLERYRSSA